MEMIACADCNCDLLQNVPELSPGTKAHCPRCAHAVAVRMAEPIDLPLALTVTAAIVFIVANTSPLMSLSAVGRHASTTIADGAFSGKSKWVQIDPSKNDADHMISPEERLRLPMARQ